MIRDRPAVVPAMGCTRLTPGSFGLTLGKTTGERGGLASGGTLRGFQFLAQYLDFLLEPLILFLQLLVSLAGLVAFLPRTTQLLHQISDAADRIEGFEKQIIL
jgi:hypothetical protein